MLYNYIQYSSVFSYKQCKQRTTTTNKKYFSMRDLTEVKSWCQNTRIRGQRNRGPVAQTQAGSARFICFFCDKAGRSIAKHSFIDAVAKAMMPYSNCTLSSKESCNMWAYAKTSKGLIYIWMLCDVYTHSGILWNILASAYAHATSLCKLTQLWVWLNSVLWHNSFNSCLWCLGTYYALASGPTEALVSGPFRSFLGDL